MIEEIPRAQFFNYVIDKTQEQVVAKLGWKDLNTEDRGNVLIIPLRVSKGCHYEIGLHQDCHEIALHFQGSAENNSSRLDGFRPYRSQLNVSLGHTVILGPHEGQGRKRLWIKLPLEPCTQDLAAAYGDLTARLIILTFPILKSILDKENRRDTC